MWLCLIGSLPGAWCGWRAVGGRGLRRGRIYRSHAMQGTKNGFL